MKFVDLMEEGDSYYMEDEVMKAWLGLKVTMIFLCVWVFISAIVRPWGLGMKESFIATAIIFWGGYKMFYE